MITGDQELQWAYLLCPTFELSNSEGKPLTNGYIELYIAGTRDKYYAASDFNGTLHPFQIPLDSLGANIVLVNPGQAYDVYVYNRFGNLIMSRYNVTAVGAGSGSGNSNFTIDSSDGTVVVTESTDPETGVKTYDLSVPSVSGDASYWMGRGAATMGVNIEDTEYHDIQISSNSIRNEGEDIEVLDGKFSLKKGVYFWSVTVQLDKFESFDNTRQKVYVESTYNRGIYTMDMTHDESETVTFSGITVADHDGDTEGFKVKSEGTSPIRATLYHVAIHRLNPKVLGEGAHGKTYTGGDFIEITDDDVINVTGVSSTEDVERMITEAVTSIVSGEGIYTAGDYISIVNREISVTGLQPEGDYLTPEDLEGYATETYVDNSVSSFVTESTVTSLIQEAITGIEPGEIYVPGQYVEITDENVINVTGLQPEGDYLTQEDLEGYATETYVDNSVTAFVDGDTVSAIVTNMVTAILPPEIPLVAGDGIIITETEDHIEIAANVTSIEGYATESYVTAYVDNSISDFTTHNEVNEAIVTAIQTATGAIPDQLEAGEYISIVDNKINVTGLQEAGDYATHTDVYEAIVTGVQAATSEIPDVSDFATHTEVYDSSVTSIQLVTGLIPDVSDFTTHSEVHDATVTAIETVTAMIPEAQVQSDWTEDDTESPAYIQNKPEESLLVAGNGIEITESDNTIVISANVTSIDGYAKIEDVYDATVTAVQVATGLIPDVSDFTTHSEVHEATVTAIETATAAIPDTEEVQFEELDITQFAMASAIPDVSNKKDKQTAVHLTQGDTWTVTSVNQNANGEIEVEWAPIPLDGFINEEQLIEAVSGVTGIGDYGQFYSTDITGAATMAKAKGTIDVTNDGKIKLKQGQSYHVTVRGRYVQGTAANTYTAVSYIEYVTNNSINFNVDKTKTESQYFELSYDLYKLSSDTNYYVFFTGVDGLIKDLFIEIHAIGSVGDGQGGGSGTEYDAGWGIRILNNVISVNPDIIATVTGVEALIQNVTATIPSAQVQSDWTENDSDEPSYIQNKPVEKQLVAGANVTITSTATSVIISSTGGSGDVTEAMLYDATVTAVQAATGSIPDVSDFATNADVYDAVVTGVQVATGAIPDVSNFVTEEQVTALIPDVPEVKDVVAGEGITITENATAIVISSDVQAGVSEAEVYDATVTAVQTATGLIPDTSDMATKTWVGNQGYLTEVPSTYATDIEVSQAIASSVSDFVTESEVTALIPDTEDVDFEELDITQFAQVSAIPDVSDMATKTWVGNQGYLTSIPSTYATDTEVYEATVTAVQMATGAIPAQVQSDWAVTAVDDPAYIDNKPEIVEMEILTVSAGNGISIETNATGVIISSTGGSGSGVTEAEVYDATVTAVQAATGAIPAQVQSDWAVTAVDSPAYIQNKPTEKNLIAGANVTITESNDEVTIETTEIASGLQLIAGPGIVFTVSGNNLVAKADETVIYENSNPTAILSDTSVDLSESYLNFKELKLYLKASFGSTGNMTYISSGFVQQSDTTELGSLAMSNANSSIMCDSNCYVFTTSEPLKCYIKANGVRINITTSGITTMNSRGTTLYKIVGINRIAGGN